MSSTEALQPDKDAVLYLVDGSSSMVSSRALSKVLAAVVSSILLIYRRGDRRFDVGVIIYGTVNTHPKRSRYFDVDVLMRVSDPRVEDLKRLIELVQSGGPAEPRPAGSGKSSLLNALQQVKLEMASLNPSVFRRLVLITDDDSPPDLAGVRELAHDLVNLNVLTVPTFIEHGGRSFDNAKFWRHLVYLPPALSMASRNAQLGVSLDPYNIDDLPTEFANLVQSKTERKLPVFRGELVLQSLRIGVAAYSIVNKSAAPRKHTSRHAGFENAERESSHPTQVSENEGESRHFVLGAHQTVPVGEVDDLYALRPDTKYARIEIRGFVPVEKLRPLFAQESGHFGKVGSSLLIVPSNFVLENSKPALSSLRRSMIRKSSTAWAVLYPKSGSRPPVYGFLLAFDPSRVVFQEQKELRPSTHNGLYFVGAAYADDLRHAPDHLEQTATDDHGSPADTKLEAADLPSRPLVETLQRLVRKFRVKAGFDPAQFPHPGRLQFASVLESLALDLDMSGHEAPDSTLPDYNKIAKHVSSIAGEISETMAQIAPKGESKKRKIADLNEFREAHSIGRLHCFKVPDLKWALGELDLVVSGNKPELVSRLAEHL